MVWQVCVCDNEFEVNELANRALEHYFYLSYVLILIPKKIKLILRNNFVFPVLISMTRQKNKS